MKLRNKKTGVIIPIEIHNIGGKSYETLKEINEDWEDYEETKEYWCISLFDSDVIHVKDADDEVDTYNIRNCNYFSTKEEAEKAVKKFKAWKRLKDAGFEFKGWKVLDHDSPRIYFNVYRKNSDDIVPFLDLLFGGEE